MIQVDYFWTNILALGVVTFVIRASFIALSSRIEINDRLREIFSFIPASVLPAFIAPAVYFHQGHIQLFEGKERLVVITLSGIICFMFRNTFVTITFGIILLYILNVFF